ncbi:MAG: bifunctional adenosylcobinamide kinase/adenosylcobinamide-phosphate guanylyltransferase [Rhodobiaceae bacterium]|nr:MAG: bifunctional adenosylcobinamide kinase/adenosylcobinamide-phosphate guanylyltransferase [Rhodobiaceae bacterium]
MTADTFSLPAEGPFAALILGGARSGKSRYGEALVRASSGRAVYIATAEARDDEMTARIAKHREQRGSDWALIEEPIHLARVLREQVRAEDVVLVDCLTLWLSNLMGEEREIASAVDELLAAIETCPARIVFISNEIGWGIVPDNALARTFRDEAGRLHQQLSAQIDAVVAVIAGLPLMLKEPGGP